MKPDWIRGKISWDKNFSQVKKLLSELGLNTVCLSAACPNRGECWESGHLTFMILGRKCTRGCLFCDVLKGEAEEVNTDEPAKIAEAINRLRIKYVVITSVTRDDLRDRGTNQFIKTVKSIKQKNPDTVVELLIPDMGAKKSFLKKIATSGADVIGHNIEMPRGLYSHLRPTSNYKISLKTLLRLKKIKPKTPLKSALMVGLGEKKEDVLQTMQDLRDAGVDILYVGQYLAPTKLHWKVDKYYDLEEFDEFQSEGQKLGFKVVYSAPLIRSSYKAAEAYQTFYNS